MKKRVQLLSYMFVFVLLLTTPITALTPSAFAGQNMKPDEERENNANQEMIQQMITQMDTEEKIGQLVMPSTHDNEQNMPNEDTKELIQEYKAGSVIIYGNRDASTTAAYNNQLQEWAAETNMGIPLFSTADLEYGVNQHVTDATAFPRQMGIAATRDLEAAEDMASVTAREMKATGFNWNYSPLADVNTNPNNPVIGVRSFGEDTELVSDMTVAQVEGYQENGVLSTPKHFPGHGDTSDDSHYDLPSVGYDRETLEEVHLPPFQAAIDAGADSIMTSHVIIEAIDPELPATLSEDVLTGLLREEMGFNGLIVTDAMSMQAIKDNWGAGEAAVMTIQAGADIVMATGSLDEQKESFEALLSAYESGELTQERVDESLERILAKKVMYGLFDNRYVDPEEATDVVNTESHKELAKNMAQDSMTLVKNDDVLPFDPESNESTFVVGPEIYNQSYYIEDIAEDVQRKTNGNVDYDVTSENPSAEEINEVVQQAEQADRVIVSTFSADELDQGQSQLVNALEETEKPVVSISLGLPYDIKEYPDVDAHIATYAIERWGSAVPVSWEAAVDVIYGANPGGKLPVTIEGHYEFGHGENYEAEIPENAEDIKTLVDQLKDEGEFESDTAPRALNRHLTAVNHYEVQEAVEKVIKHMQGFNDLLDHQQNNELISVEAYNLLQSQADMLIEKWEAFAFDSDRAMAHIRHLSEDIGPRAPGSEGEEEASEYIKAEFEKLGYNASTQTFDIPNGAQSQNVIAVKEAEGIEDPEIVYVTAHYDSVPGSPGANDNGSGTAALLELAKVTRDEPANKEIRFVAFGAEEAGLLGSEHYVSQLSDEEINRSAANFNLDMVGTDWEPASQLHVSTVDGESNTVWESVDLAAERLGLDDNRLTRHQLGRSDHVHFHNAGIDAALFIWMERGTEPGQAGIEPWYHSPEDTIDRVSPEKVQMVGDLIDSAISDIAFEQEQETEATAS
ncbi:M28 family peptidase [Virgibacillus sp. NKC19-16]|uniref:glycoside hydrolase family 3 N-terminal domain-containing protein n=1 Tax=Virgibacillus salidurans TaxID=2831673 RepID=UPI001F1CD22A|nr:glycoside hydrolase family 3 N-terminal domain-containing protein [Virgibacillus sp. NKC19-16]UJL45938.1 M28 family peptidase [Virgibacillus sp. NKC19-16]